MKSIHWRNIAKYALIAFSLVTVNTALAQTDEAEVSKQFTSLIEIRPYLLFGVGVSNLVVGEAKNQSTGEVKKVKLSPGGGLGYGSDIRINFNPDIALEFGAALHRASESPAVDDASAEFTYTRLKLGAVYKTILESQNQMYFGFGGLQHLSPKLKVSGFADANIEYEDANGFKVYIGLDLFVGKLPYTLSGEIRYTSVQYTATTLKSNGKVVDDILASGKSLKTIDGSGIEMQVSIVFY